MGALNPDANAKQVEVVIVSGDDDVDGYRETIENLPFLAVPFADLASRKVAIEKKIACHFYPQPSVVDAKSGKVLNGKTSSEAEALHGEISSGNAKAFLDKYLPMCN